MLRSRREGAHEPDRPYGLEDVLPPDAPPDPPAYDVSYAFPDPSTDAFGTSRDSNDSKESKDVGESVPVPGDANEDPFAKSRRARVSSPPARRRGRGVRGHQR